MRGFQSEHPEARHGSFDASVAGMLGELEVAGLIAEGLSNRVIAERLHLSERTAESHVKNICDKLGFNSTSQGGRLGGGRTAGTVGPPRLTFQY
jgi:hypothetical protein